MNRLAAFTLWTCLIGLVGNAATLIGASIAISPRHASSAHLTTIKGSALSGNAVAQEQSEQSCYTSCYNAGGHGFRCFDTHGDVIEVEYPGGEYRWDGPTIINCSPLIRYDYEECYGSTMNIGDCDDTRQILQDP